MKRTASLAAAALFCAALGPYEDLVEERVRSATRVCLEGQACGRGGASVVVEPVATVAAARSGKEVYDLGCAVCHNTGVGGAHVLGAGDAWAEIVARGRDQAIQNAIKGIGAMPPRGVCINCTDEEIIASVDYMLSAAGF